MRQHPIWAVLRKQGRTKAWLARETGYSYQHIKSMASGIYASSQAFRSKAAALLQMPEELLFSDEADALARKRWAERRAKHSAPRTLLSA